MTTYLIIGVGVLIATLAYFLVQQRRGLDEAMQTIDNLQGKLNAAQQDNEGLADLNRKLNAQVQRAADLVKDTNEAVNGLLADQAGFKESNYRLLRQHELALTYNPRVHGVHECCPCVKDLQAYSQKAKDSIGAVGIVTGAGLVSALVKQLATDEVGTAEQHEQLADRVVLGTDIKLDPLPEVSLRALRDAAFAERGTTTITNESPGPNITIVPATA